MDSRCIGILGSLDYINGVLSWLQTAKQDVEEGAGNTLENANDAQKTFSNRFGSEGI